MRDLLLIGIVIPGCLIALKRPWFAVMLWTWLCIVSPHRYTYGCTYSSALAAMVVSFAMQALLFSKEKSPPFKGTAVIVLILFMVWVRETVKSPAVVRVMESRTAAVFAKSFLDLMSSQRNQSILRFLAKKLCWNKRSLVQIALFRGTTDA
jgi:hypothetical protein